MLKPVKLYGFPSRKSFVPCASTNPAGTLPARAGDAIGAMRMPKGTRNTAAAKRCARPDFRHRPPAIYRVSLTRSSEPCLHIFDPCAQIAAICDAREERFADDERSSGLQSLQLARGIAWPR